MLNRIKDSLRQFELYRKVFQFQHWQRNYGYMDQSRFRWIFDYHEHQQGGKISCERKLPLNHEGLPIPWITHSALDFLLQFDFSNCDIFEYGSGNSSHFWAKRCRQLVSVESDEKWAAYNRQVALPNQRLICATEELNYAGSIATFNKKFEVIVIDGDFRPACALAALPHLADNGMVVLDNSDWFPKTVAYLASKDFTQIDFVGPGPINNYLWATSFFLAPRFRIPRVHTDGQIVMTGGIGHNLDAEASFKSKSVGIVHD